MKLRYVWLFTLLTSLLSEAGADDPSRVGDDAGVLFFEQHVRPVLVEHCFSCHSAEHKQKAGLLLDDRDSLLRGGDNGPAVIPGDASRSLLIQAVKHSGDVTMPPESKLSDEQIAALEKWVNLGLPYPRGRATSDNMAIRFAQAQQHWAFQPLSHAVPPTVNNLQWARNNIDLFVLAKLEELAWQPARAADRATLIRRVSLDLTGLLPIPEEVSAFVEDQSPQAYEKLVDRLLASPHYGERWGRHWLDLARYADSSGFHNDLDRPWAWKYRDYVINSFNVDKPYPRFVAEQLAGDEVAAADVETWIATGFGRNGPSNDDNMGKTEAALKQYRADQLDDVISTTATVFLGVTLGCARCHDHKTDPFTTQDYYRLLAIFNGTEEYGESPSNKGPKGAKTQGPPDPSRMIQARIETHARVPATFVMRRGNAANLAEEVSPAVPATLASAPLAFPEPAADAKSSGRRLTLAQWIGSTDNALTWRVLANRIWQHHFGRGLVATPSNFGFTGSRPTHPELLDYLAGQLMAHAGHWKPVHKLLVMSATYQQASQASEQQIQLDPENQWLSHMPLRRMEAELIRDSILMSSGQLNRRLGGPGIKPRLPPELIPASQRNKWPEIKTESDAHWRRSVYIYAKRQLLMPLLELFDAPTTTDSCAVRTLSVVPTQALVLMNDQFVETQAGFLAERALRESEGHQELAVKRIFQLTVGQVPADRQLQQALAFVQDRQLVSDPVSGLTDLAHVIFNSSQFIHIQ